MRLQEFAKSKCLPFLLNLPRFKPYANRLSFLLVGSVATGFCREGSDIDIAVVCDEETYRSISMGTSWEFGRPSEAKIDGVKLHYYAVSFEKIESKFKELDDAYIYVYSNVIILHDPENQYTRWFSGLTTDLSDLRKKRLENKLNMLLRRSRALKSALLERDPYSIARICFELIGLCLMAIALLDNIPFDPRKRLFTTALKGKLGKKIEGKIRCLFSSLGTLAELRDDSDFERFSFPDKLTEMMRILSKEAHRQGIRIELGELHRG